MTLKYKTLHYLSLLVALAIAAPANAADETPAKKEPEKSAVETTPTEQETHEKAAESEKSKEKVKTKLPIGKTDTVITLDNLHCKSCAGKVAGRLYTVKGVMKVRSDVAADVVIVTPQKKKQLSTKSLWSAAQKAGFQPTELEGPAGKFVADPKTKGPKLVPKQDEPPTEKVAKKPA